MICGGLLLVAVLLQQARLAIAPDDYQRSRQATLRPTERRWSCASCFPCKGWGGAGNDWSKQPYCNPT
jgi:hypothetical protein